MASIRGYLLSRYYSGGLFSKWQDFCHICAATTLACQLAHQEYEMKSSKEEEKATMSKKSFLTTVRTLKEDAYTWEGDDQSTASITVKDIKAKQQKQSGTKENPNLGERDKSKIVPADKIPQALVFSHNSHPETGFVSYCPGRASVMI
eukprot:15328165-Ditylum_brightwellii.AAC.1